MRPNAWKGTLLAKEALRPYLLRWLYYPLFPAARPAFFTNCWRYPNSAFPTALTPGVCALLPEPAREPDLLFLPMTDWHVRTQRTQQLALAFAQAGHRCFYVNPYLGRQFPRVYFRDRAPRVSMLAPGIAEVHLRLPREPVIHHRLPTRGERRRVVDALASLVQAGGVRRLVQIVSLPFWWEIASELKSLLGCPVIYDCHDLLEGLQGVMPQVADHEPGLFQLCDRAVFSSQPLMDSKLAQFPWLQAKSLLVRNAAAAGGFAAEAGVPGCPSRAQAGKVIGYMGALDHWFDVPAVREAARRRPGWEFVLLGRVESRSLLALRGLPNVKFLGEVRHSELPRHLARFDVALIPFLRNELTVAANPIKLYEYFSFGLPVVSARLPEVEMFGDLVYLAGDPGQFAEQVERAACEEDPSLRRRRMEIAQRESWAGRARQFQEAFELLLEAS